MHCMADVRKCNDSNAQVKALHLSHTDQCAGLSSCRAFLQRPYLPSLLSPTRSCSRKPCPELYKPGLHTLQQIRKTRQHLCLPLRTANLGQILKVCSHLLAANCTWLKSHHDMYSLPALL